MVRLVAQQPMDKLVRDSFSFPLGDIKPLKYKIPFSRPELWFLLLPPGMKGSTISHLYHEQLFRIYSIKKQFNNPTWKFHPATIHTLQCMTMCQLSYLQLFGSSWLAHTFNSDSFHNYFFCLSRYILHIVSLYGRKSILDSMVCFSSLLKIGRDDFMFLAHPASISFLNTQLEITLKWPWPCK